MPMKRPTCRGGGDAAEAEVPRCERRRYRCAEDQLARWRRLRRRPTCRGGGDVAEAEVPRYERGAVEADLLREAETPRRERGAAEAYAPGTPAMMRLGAAVGAPATIRAGQTGDYTVRRGGG